ncbi:MAG: tetratricopeptide repeat protein [Gemmatimonadales bacterium]|nr:tetratricopeptide repeat protein [Gemmatimonadales bacterium]
MTFPPSPDDPGRTLRDLVAAGRFQEALETFGEGGGASVDQEPDTLLLAAKAATRVGQLDLATKLAARALEEFRTKADADGRMQATNLLGALAFERGHVAEAEDRFGQALVLAQELSDSLVAARASNNLASVAHLRGRPDLALSLYRNAMLSYQRLGDRRGTAETYHNLGLTFRDMAALSDADDAANEAVRHASMAGEKALMALTLMGRAEVHLAKGDLRLARSELDQAHTLADEAGDELGAAEVRRLRALVALEDGKSTDAHAEAEAARAVAARYGSTLLQAECALASARALNALGDATAMAERRDEAKRLFESLGAQALLGELERVLPPS